MTGFRFNDDYSDLEQVAPYLPAFERRLAEIEAAGTYRYNDLFKGRVPGIEGPDEDTAIYLLQGLERQRRQDEKVEALLAQGYHWLETLNAVTRFAHVILVPHMGRLQGEWAEYRQARIVPEARREQAEVTGRLSAILPKGARTHGFRINGRRVLVKP